MAKEHLQKVTIMPNENFSPEKKEHLYFSLPDFIAKREKIIINQDSLTISQF